MPRIRDLVGGTPNLFGEPPAATATATATKTAEIWKDSISKVTTCRGCPTRIVFALRVGGRATPFRWPLAIVAEHEAEAPGRTILQIVDTNHFSDCPQAARFSHSGRR